MILNKIRLSLRTAIFIVFFIFSLIMILSVMYIQFYRENETLNVMSERIIDTRGEAVSNALNYYIHIPQQANSIAAIFIKTLDTDNWDLTFQQIEGYLYKVMTQTFSKESLLSSIAFGSVQGNYIGFGRDLETNWTFQIKKNHETHNKLLFYKDGTSESPVLYSVDDYNLFDRPWFSAVNASRRSMWSNAYRDVNSESGVSISFSSPVSDKNGHYIGVISSDLRLSRLNRFLASLTATEHSLIYLVNDKEQIIAASAPELLQGKRSQGLAEQSGADLPNVKDSSEAVVKATAQYVRDNNTSINRIDISGTRYFSKVIQVGDSLNLKGWKMVVLVSENELTGKLSKYRDMTLLIAGIVLLLGCFLSHRILSVVVNPLRKIAEQAPDIALRRKIDRNYSWSFKEITTLDNALNRMAGDLDTAFARLENQINIDSETGLLTRKGLLAEHKTISSSFRGVVGVVTLSNLQTMINNLGNGYAISYLESFINFLYQYFPSNAIVARDSIERLIICCPGSSEKDISENIHRLMNLMQAAESEYVNSMHVFMGYVGIVSCAEGDLLETLIISANIAQQAALHQENGNARVYDDSLRELALKNINILNHLYGAIPNNELYLVYQPIITLGDSEVREAECLIRWENPALGMVRPDQFIQVAEESGFIIQLGRWIIAEACQELASRIAHNFCSSNFKLHINVSIIELAQPDFCEYILTTIEKAGLSPRNICIEITETSMIKGDELLKSTLAVLRTAGVSVSIDDFGSGFSSLSYLHKLEFDALKIDRNFVMDVLNNKKNESIISAVILLAKGFNVPLIAEGVETKEVADKLQTMGCEKAQGYYFSRPVPFDQWPDALLNHH